MCVCCVQSVCPALQKQQTENIKLLRESRELRAAADRVQVRSLTGTQLCTTFELCSVLISSI